MNVFERRVYLSGPITGIENYKKDFESVEAELNKLGFEKVVNPSWLDVVITNGDYEEYMQGCLALIDLCDIVVMLPGWEKSAGANREMGYALGKDKLVVDWKNRSSAWRA